MADQRTVVYTVKVNTDDAKKGSRAMTLTMKSMSDDAKTATAKMQKLGDTIGKQYGANVKVAEESTKTIKAQIRQSASEASKAQKNFNVLSKEYRLLSSRIGRTADQQEQLNALYRLGSNATLTQKKRTLELVKAYQAQRAAGANVQRSFRGMRGQMQNFGFQMQDVAVQMQMGTNAMTIFSQQGSQLAAGFGPTGAVVGAVIAFAGMIGTLLLPNLFKSSKEIDNLTESLKGLAKTTGLTVEQSELLVLKEKEAIKEAAKKLETLKKEQKELEKTNKEAQKRLKIGQDSRNNDERVTKSLESYNRKLLENKVSQQEQNRIITQSNENVKVYQTAIGQSIDQNKKWKDSNKDIVDTLEDQVRQLGLSKSQLLELKRDQELKTLADQNANEETKEKVRLGYEELIVAARLEEQARATNKQIAENSKVQNAAIAAEKRLLTLRAGLTDSGKLDQLNARYQEEKLLLAGHHDELIALEKQYDRDKLQITGTSWEKYIDSLKTSAMDFETLSANMLEGSIQNLSDGIGNAIVNADDLGDALEGTFKSVAAAGISALVQMGIQRLIFSNLDVGLKGKEVAAHTTGEAVKTEATLAARTVEMLALKAVYIANVAARGGAETSLGALNAAAATAAIPVVGPILAPAAAATFTSFGTGLTATALGFAGAFDKGGIIPQGMTGIMSEYGDEMVNGVLVKGGQGGTRVTSREETAKIINNKSGGNTFTINSSGNASPEAIARATARLLSKPNKVLDTAVYDATKRGSTNRGKRFA
jgi:hypothetical protein